MSEKEKWVFQVHLVLDLKIKRLAEHNEVRETTISVIICWVCHNPDFEMCLFALRCLSINFHQFEWIFVLTSLCPRFIHIIAWWSCEIDHWLPFDHVLSPDFHKVNALVCHNLEVANCCVNYELADNKLRSSFTHWLLWARWHSAIHWKAQRGET